ncbi:hypothetical protein scyTo_0010081 [Scyliorhinus torazame]|uniref:Uncharacterized protein n=1 Tax=Scyliorhinus torazame TaxID=75743 RepID=A0A401NZF7_SCYTO|nr:hypothetical protein [Scyliorhinus torazame]
MAEDTSRYLSGDYYPRKFGPKPDVVPSGVTERKISPFGIGLDKPDMVVVDVVNVKEEAQQRVQEEFGLGREVLSERV